MKILKKSMKIAIGILFLSNISLADMESAVSKMGEEISQSILSEKKKKIAVIAFANLDGSVNDLGRFIANKLTTKLFQIEKKSYTIIERTQLSKILEELKLSSTGLLEPKAMKTIGKLHGVDVIVLGSLTDFGSAIEVEVKAISIETGGLMAVASSKIPKVDHVKKLFGENSKTMQIIASGSKTASSTSNSDKPSGKSKDLIFNNENFTISLKRIKKDGNKISMITTYTNKTKGALYIDIYPSKSFLSDENGEVWTNTGNTALSGKTVINGEMKIVSKMTFTASGANDGTLFNFKAYYATTKNYITMMFNDIKIP